MGGLTTDALTGGAPARPCHSFITINGIRYDCMFGVDHAGPHGRTGEVNGGMGPFEGILYEGIIVWAPAGSDLIDFDKMTAR